MAQFDKEIMIRTDEGEKKCVTVKIVDCGDFKLMAPIAWTWNIYKLYDFSHYYHYIYIYGSTLYMHNS